MATATVSERPLARARTRAATIKPSTLALAVSLPAVVLITRIAVWTSPTTGRWRIGLFDDAMISMSYARTLADTGELVWFAGAPRTEGMTNLGWTLVMAALHWLGLSDDGVVVAIMALGLAAVWGTAMLARWLVRAMAGTATTRTDVLAVLAVAGSFPLLWWSVRGMEVGVMTLLTVLALTRAVALAERPCRADLVVLSLAIVVGITVRTDFAAVAGAIGLWLVSARGIVDRWRTLVVVGATTAASLLACAAFRIAYYGDPFPNTYYLKLTEVDALDHLLRGGWATVLTGIIYFGAPVVIIATGWRRLSGAGHRVAHLVLIVAGVLVFYGAYVGADAWEFFLVPNRYLTPGLVLLFLVAAGVVASPSTATPDRRRLTVGLLVVGLGPLAGFLLATALPRTDLAIAVGVDRALWLVVALPLAVAGFVLSRRLRPAQALTALFAVGMVAGAAALPALTLDDIDDSAEHAQLGDQLHEVVTPDAHVAVTAAGGTQYFSDRPMIDLLGKSDEHIAQQGLADPDVVWPGHDKHDYAWSIGQLQPDVVAQTPRGPSVDQLLDWGYEPMALLGRSFAPTAAQVCGVRVIWVLEDSQLVRRDLLVPVSTDC